MGYNKRIMRNVGNIIEKLDHGEDVELAPDEIGNLLRDNVARYAAKENLPIYARRIFNLARSQAVNRAVRWNLYSAMQEILPRLESSVVAEYLVTMSRDIVHEEEYWVRDFMERAAKYSSHLLSKESLKDIGILISGELAKHTKKAKSYEEMHGDMGKLTRAKSLYKRIDEIRYLPKRLEQEYLGLRQEFEGLEADIEMAQKEEHKDEDNKSLERDISRKKAKIKRVKRDMGKLEKRLEKIKSPQEIRKENNRIEKILEELQEYRYISNFAIEQDLTNWRYTLECHNRLSSFWSRIEKIECDGGLEWECL